MNPEIAALESPSIIGWEPSVQMYAPFHGSDGILPQSHSLLVVHTSRRNGKTATIMATEAAFRTKLHAESLASQMNYDLDKAVGHDCSWYRELMADDATLDEAGDLRLLTMVICREHRALVREKADLVGRSPVLDELRRQERRREACVGLVALAVFLSLLLIWCRQRPSDRELREAPIARQVQQVQL